jgi:hypothetical protein
MLGGVVVLQWWYRKRRNKLVVCRWKMSSFSQLWRCVEFMYLEFENGCCSFWSVWGRMRRWSCASGLNGSNELRTTMNGGR